MQISIDNLGKVAVTVEKDYWDITKDYNRLTIVEVSGNQYKTYISRKPVPAGTVLTNREYWIPFSSLREEIVIDFNSFVASLTQAMQETKQYADNTIEQGIEDITDIKDQGIEDITAIKEEAMRIITYIAENGIDSSVLAPNSVTSDKIAPGNVLSRHIGEGEVKSSNIGTGEVKSINIGEGEVKSIDIGNGEVKSGNIGGGEVKERHIAPGAITTDKLANPVIEQLQTIMDDVPTSGSVKPINSAGVLAHGSAFDVSEYNKNEGILATYESLTAATDAVPATSRRGGMSIKFIQGNAQSSDNKYVQHRYMGTSIATADFTNPANWQGVDDEPTAGSENMVKSGGVFLSTNVLTSYIKNDNFSINSGFYITHSLPESLPAGKSYRIVLNARNFASTDRWADSSAIYLRDVNNNRLYLDALLGITGGGVIENKDYSCFIDAEYDYTQIVIACRSSYVVSEDKQFVLSVEEITSIKQEVQSIRNDFENYSERQSDINENILDSVEALSFQIEGGKKYYANQEFDVQNAFINYTMNEAVLSESILFPFKYKFSTPEGVNITSFGIRVYEEDGVTYHNYPSSGLPNEDVVATIPGAGNYKVSKIAINQVTPDVRYTGTFKIEVYIDADSVLDEKVDKTAIVQTTGADTDKIMSQKAVTDLVTPVQLKADDLDKKVNGGESIIGSVSVDAQNEWVNSNNIITDLTPATKDFTIRFETPDGSEITVFSVYLWYTDGSRISFSGYAPNTDISINRQKEVSRIAVASVTPDKRYTGHFSLIAKTNVDATVASKEDVSAVESKIDYDEREKVPDYYFNNDYLPNKVDFIRNVMEGCMVNGDTFFLQSDEHWEKNAQHSPALIKYIADRLNISRLFDCGDTCHNIDAYGLAHVNPDHIDFESLRRKTYHGRLYHVIGNHEYLTWYFTDADKWVGTDFGNWHDFMFYQRQEVDNVVFGDVDKHYYYVDNKAKKIRYIVLSSYKKKEEPIQSGTNYYSVAEYDYSNDQLLWFRDIALNVESGWTILIFTHNFISFTHGERDGEGYIADVNGFVPDKAKPFAQAILTYNGNGTIAAVFTGHWHSDGVMTIDDAKAGLTTPTGNSFKCIVTTCDAFDFDSLGESEKLYNRVADTITEQAFDVVVLDKTTRKITLVRIGAPAYNLLEQAPNGKYPLFGDLEYREVTY